MNSRLALLVMIVAMLAPLSACAEAAVSMTPTDRGATVETDRYSATIKDAVVVSFINKLTGEEYFDQHVDLADIVPHLPSGLGTQHTEAERQNAFELYKHPWWELPIDSTWSCQHYVDAKSSLAVTKDSETAMTLTYKGLTNGKDRFPDETYGLKVEVEEGSGELLLTPMATSPRKGVFGAILTASALAPSITVEAPIFDGVRLDRHMQPMLWTNHWGGYWDYSIIVLNGYKKGCVGVWCEDARLQLYKQLFYLINTQGLSFSLSCMNIPPFEEYTQAAPITWRMQAYDKPWPAAVKRFRDWRLKNVKIAKRPDWALQVSFVNNGVDASENWLDVLDAYFGGKDLQRTVTFAPVIRGEKFDRNHTNNTPYEGFKEDMKRWHEKGPKLMAYLQPMIIWSPKPTTERETQAIELHKQADTRTVFQHKPYEPIRFTDQHHLGHPGWQAWFLAWVNEYIQDYGADGVYHDQSYHCPIDVRGLEVGGMTSTAGMADYFYKAQAENSDSIHGSEHLTSINNTGASLGIGSGILWGTAQSMRHQRINHASPISNALHYPNGVTWGFPHFSDIGLHGSSIKYHWGMNLMEKRGDLPGLALQNQRLYKGQEIPYEHWQNELWLDRVRALTFVRNGLRPVFPEDWADDVVTYYRGADGQDFRYVKKPWGTAFVQVVDGKERLIYGRIHGVNHADVPGAIRGWTCYGPKGPEGLNPDLYYILDPSAKRPDVYFSTNNQFSDSFYEGYVAESFANDALAYLDIKPIASIGNITKFDNVVLHAPQEPEKIWVNGDLVWDVGGEKTDESGKPLPRRAKGVRALEEGGWQINIKLPAQVCVLLKEPPAGFDNLAAQLVDRVVTFDMRTELFDPAFLTKNGEFAQQADGCIDMKGSLWRVYNRGLEQVIIPIKAPAAGVLTLTSTRRYTPRLEGLVEVRLNGAPQKFLERLRPAPKPGRQKIETTLLEIRLADSESAVLSLTADQPMTYTFQWVPVERDADDNDTDKAAKEK